MGWLRVPKWACAKMEGRVCVGSAKEIGGQSVQCHLPKMNSFSWTMTTCKKKNKGGGPMN